MVDTSSLPARAPGELMAGDVLAGKYRFDKLLGEGGQGWVWQAQNLLLDIPVAIKVVRSEDDGDQSLPERLFREARAAARLGHPAIVRVFDLGQANDGSPFVVMELLEGENLADRLVQSGRLSPELAVRLLLPIADALVAAHGKEIVHRDVKPDNVFLARLGASIQPKLLDFGIAKVSPKVGRSRELTESGAIVGSPSYLSPEQARGASAVDARADVWSFSATLYEALTGQVPFEGETWRVLRQRILEEEPRPISDFGIEDERLWEIVRRGLAKSPLERWPDMQSLAGALACWLMDQGVTEDICGVSLEARWLRSIRLPVELVAIQPSMIREAQSSAPEAGETRRSQSLVRPRRNAPRASAPATTGSKWLSALHAWVDKLFPTELVRTASKRVRTALGLVGVLLVGLGITLAFSGGNEPRAGDTPVARADGDEGPSSNPPPVAESTLEEAAPAPRAVLRAVGAPVAQPKRTAGVQVVPVAVSPDGSNAQSGPESGVRRRAESGSRVGQRPHVPAVTSVRRAPAARAASSRPAAIAPSDAHRMDLMDPY